MDRKVAFYMSKNPISLSEDTSLQGVMNTLDQSKISHLMVVDYAGNLAGVISKTDILKKTKAIIQQASGKAYAQKMLETTLAKDIMTKQFISVRPEDAASYAIELFLQKEFHCVPVIDQGKPVGILTLFDLMKGYYQEVG